MSGLSERPAATHLRIARPVSQLERSAAMYCRGLGLTEVGRFEDHDGYDGIMLGSPGLAWHFEFTRHRHHPVGPAPTREDLIVVYVPDPCAWKAACLLAVEAGFVEVAPSNPYWQTHGRTFEDHDHYRIVICRDAWTATG